MVGRTVSHYRILAPIGHGGMGVVYRAEDTRLLREVAVKFLPDSLTSEPLSLERFRREARMASRLNHPHICTVYDIGEHERQPFLVMEFLEGQTLKSFIDHNRIGPSKLVQWACEIAGALEAAHSVDIIHRDVKPANLFLTAQGHIKVLDFGLARPVGRAVQRSSRHAFDKTETMLEFETSPGSTVGTIAYMSPEQARGENLDRRTDIFSLGIVLYEMATNEIPFPGSTTAVIFDALLNREPIPVLKRNAELPPDMAHIIERCLAKDPELRYQSMKELHADLDGVASGNREITTGRPRKGAVHFAFRYVPVWIALACAILILAVSVVTRSRSKPQEKELIPVRVTSNGSDAAIATMDLSPDGKYLAYSDPVGVHLRSIETGDTTLLAKTRGMAVEHWANNSTQFYVSQLAGEHAVCLSISLPGGVPHLLGDAIPSPKGKFTITLAKAQQEVRRQSDGRSFSLSRPGLEILHWAWSPAEQHLAITYLRQSVAMWTEALDLQSGRWSTLVPAAKYGLGPMAWSSENRLLFARTETPPRNDWNLWEVEIDPLTGKGIGNPKRRTAWTDFQMEALSISADARRLTILRSSGQSNILIGELQANASKLVQLRNFTHGDAVARPTWWTNDSRVLLFDWDRDGKKQIYKQAIDSESAQLLVADDGSQLGPRIAPDGRWVVYVSFRQGSSTIQTRLMKVPLDGGPSEMLFDVEGYVGFSCSKVADGLCVVAEAPGGTETVSLFDPASREKRSLLKLTTGRSGAPDIAADGNHIAFVMPGSPRNTIRVVDLTGATTMNVTAPGVQNLATLKWAADGKSFYSTDVQPSLTRLLHVRQNGGADSLFEQQGSDITWGVPSPDGRLLALFDTKVLANVWLVEAF